MRAEGLVQEAYDTRQLSPPHLRLINPEESALSAAVIAETPEDEFNRAYADRLIRAAVVAGSLGVDAEVEIDTDSQADDPDTKETVGTERYPTLMHAIHAAAAGDPRARKMVDVNAATLGYEIVFKAGHISETTIFADSNGELFQYGQPMNSVLVNGLLFASEHPLIKRRTVPEIRNGVRMAAAMRRGQLKDHYFVVISRYIDGVQDKEAKELGLFPDTKSASIQVTTEVSDGQLLQQTAFWAGVRDLDAPRHDGEAVRIVGEQLGIDLNCDDAETIDRAILVPKNLMPEGILDFVRWLDEAAGGTFFGEDKPVQDYLAHYRLCKAREVVLRPTIQEAVEELISEASAITSPELAVERLHELIDAKLIERAVYKDKTIDPHVFGAQAAALIMEGRRHVAEGNLEAAEKVTSKAKTVSESTGCPSAMRQKTNSSDKKEDAADDPESEGSSELCIIVTQSCYCCSYNSDGTKSTVRKTVRAYHDAKGDLRCMRFGCEAWISADGRKKDIGRIAKKAQLRSVLEESEKAA